MSAPAPLRYCADWPCPNLVIRGRCTYHQRQYEGARANVGLRRFYRTARWARLRAVILAAQPLCPECATGGITRGTVDVHHRIKATLENFFDASILEALCHDHHSAHTARGE